MTRYKAKIVLAWDVFRKIKWFTNHWDKEIGAVGTGSIKEKEGNKYFFIDALYFPKQEVTGASVTFGPEGWSEIIKSIPMEELGRICFYWHKHPGSAACSSVDERDTFDTFMGPKEVKYFVFLQTADRDNGPMDRECRIDIRNPIRATILDDQIELLNLAPPEDIEFDKVCNKIIKDCIIEKKWEPKQYNQTH